MARYIGPKCKLSRREGTDLMMKWLALMVMMKKLMPKLRQLTHLKFFPIEFPIFLKNENT
jgi:hypothetical protein